MQYGDGGAEMPMYGTENPVAGMTLRGPSALNERQSATGLLNQQVEEVSMQVAEVLKMAAEIRDRLIGSEPQVSSTAGIATPSPANCGGVFGTTSGRLHTIKAGLEEARRHLGRLLSEV